MNKQIEELKPESIVFKYKLEAKQTQKIDLYKYATILSAKAVGDDIYIWALVNLNKPNEERVIVTLTTGNSWVDDSRDLRHIDTVIMDDGLVFHIFEEI